MIESNTLHFSASREKNFVNHCMHFCRGFALLIAGLVVTTVRAQEVSQPPFAGISQAVAAARTSDFGESGPAMEYLRGKVLDVQLDPLARNELANTLAASIGSDDSSYAFKVFVCRQLYLIGGEDQIDELASLLKEPQLADLARYALEVIPGSEINDLFWETIAQVDGPTAAGLATSLAARGGSDTVSRLESLLKHPHRDVVVAALIGLGRIGGVDAELALRHTFSGLPEDVHTEYFEALLACADRYQDSGRPDDAARIFDELMRPEMPLPVRLAAFNGFVSLRGEAATPLIVQALVSKETPWIQAALAHVRTCGGSESSLYFAGQLAVVAPDIQVLLLQALADRGDPVTLSIVTAGLQSTEALVRYACIEALGKLGNETSVPLLVNTLLSQDPEAVERSRESLVDMADMSVSAALIELYGRGDDDTRTAIAPILAARQATDAIPNLLNAAANQVGEVRSSANQALGLLARADDLNQLVALFYEADSEVAREESVQALGKLCRRIGPSEERSTIRAAIYIDAPTALTRCAALELFRDLGDDTLLPLVISACTDTESIVRATGVDVLAGWPNASPLEEVVRLAEESTDDVTRIAALNGYIRMLRMPSDRTPAQQLARFEHAITLADSDPDTLIAILAGLSEIASPEALALANDFTSRPEIHLEAATAAERIRSHYYRISASDNLEHAVLAADGNIDSCWASATNQSPGQWIEIDMSEPVAVKGIALDASRAPGGFPRGYAVYLFQKNGDPGNPIAEGIGAEGITEVIFPRAVEGQILRIIQTGEAEVPWILNEVRILPG